MRGYNPDPNERPRPIFSRTADGRLHAGGNRITPPAVPAYEDTHVQPSQQVLKPHAQHAPQTTSKANQTDATDAKDSPLDVGDIWTEQERIRLKENWEFDERKKARRERRKELFRKKLTGIPSPAATSVDASVSPSQPVHTDPKEITLNISMPSVPKVTLPSFRIPAFPRVSKRRLIMVGIVMAVLVVGAAGYGVYKAYFGKKSGSASATANSVKIEHLDASKQTSKPNYQTILPEGKSIENYGAWVRVSPENKNPVYAYADKLNNVLINVSEQPVPVTFKADIQGSMKKLAEQYSANDIVTAGDVTAYIGTSIKGPQSVLLIKDDILILMKSASRIPDNYWTDYIRSLR
jgi:hypothetical protein